MFVSVAKRVEFYLMKGNPLNVLVLKLVCVCSECAGFF